MRELTNCCVPLSFGWYAASPLILPKCNSWVSLVVVFDHGLEDLSSVVLCGICSCHIQFQHVVATSWLTGGDTVPIIDKERFVTSVSPSTLLEAPLSKSGSWQSQNLTRRSHPIELSTPVLTKFVRFWHNQGSVAPLADVPLENGRSLRFRLKVEAPVSNIQHSRPVPFLHPRQVSLLQ